jgi:uncharacterized protein YjbI with pentapeptide repeats
MSLDELKRLQIENEVLKAELAKIKLQKQKKLQNKWNLFKWASFTIGSFWFGKNAKESLLNLIDEISEGKFKKETLVTTAYHFIWRFTRIGIFAIFIALIPIIFLLYQTWLLRNQNQLLNQQNLLVKKQTELFAFQNNLVKTQTNEIVNQTRLLNEQTKLFTNQNEFVEQQTTLLEKQNQLVYQQNLTAIEQSGLFREQNNRVKQQNYLSEASRRSSLVLLISNIEDRIAEELNPKTGNEVRKLSNPLVGRIIALCNNLKPYQYLEEDSLTTSISPERGQLLISLLNAQIDTTETLPKIFGKATFTNSDLYLAQLENCYLCEIDLGASNLGIANLEKAKLRGARLAGTNFWKCRLKDANLQEAYLIMANFEEAFIENANFKNAYLYMSNFSKANLFKANLENTILYNADFRGAFLKDANFNNAELDNLMVNDLNIASIVKNFPYEKYEVDKKPLKNMKTGETYYLVKKKTK